MSDKQIRAEVNAAFRFIVEIGNEPYGVFTECTLPIVEWEIEEVKEGGLNTYVHQLPGRRKATRITLKRGVGKNKLVDWYLEMMHEKFERRSVTVKLLDMAYKPIMTWQLQNAFPVKWTGPQLKSSDSSLAIQTLELVGGEFTVST